MNLPWGNDIKEDLRKRCKEYDAKRREERVSEMADAFERGSNKFKHEINTWFTVTAPPSTPNTEIVLRLKRVEDAINASFRELHMAMERISRDEVRSSDIEMCGVLLSSVNSLLVAAKTQCEEWRADITIKPEEANNADE